MTPPDPGGFVIVTPGEMWSELRATRDAVSNLAHRMEDIPGKMSDQEARIRILEQRMWSFMGVVSFLVVVLSVAAALFPR
jgi:hypothetical protein